MRSTPAQRVRPDGTDSLEALASALLEEQAGSVEIDRAASDSASLGSVSDPSDSPGPVVLHLDELLFDADGNVVVSCGEGVAQLVLEGRREVGARGLAAENTLVSGEPVEGMGYVSFTDGSTVYHPVEMLVTVGAQEG